MYVKDLEGNEYSLKATVTNEYKLNGMPSLSAKIKSNTVNDLFIDAISEMWIIADHDETEYKIIYHKKQGSGQKLNIDIRAKPLFFDDMNNDRIYERIDEHMTATEAFNMVFAGSGYTFVLVDAFTAVQWEGFGDGETKLETFSRCIERYECEFRIVGKTVYLEKQIGRDTSIQYRYKLNASNIIQEVDANELWTYIKGFGDYEDGEEDPQTTAKLKREYTSPLASVLGERHAPPLFNGKIKNAAEMDKRLKKVVDESLKISVSATIHDLRKQNYPIAQSEVGDRVFLLDERIKLNTEVRVVNQFTTKDWQGNIINIGITFGSESLSKRYQSNIQTAVKRINDVFEGRKKIELSFLDQRVQEISRIINGNTDSVFKYMENGIVGWNGDNPNYMTRYVGDAIGFSTDGGQTYGTAMSAELGIVADYITTGTLRSIIVEAVEIYGSTFYSEVSPIEYTKIEGSYIESRGEHERTWRGNTTTHDVLLKLENGLFRARNNDKNWSLYLSDWGLSTYNDATGNDDASGFIEFHSKDYSPSGAESGLTLFSLAGRIGLETDGSRIYLNPSGASVRVSDIDDNYYPIAASSFTQSSHSSLKRDIKPLQDDALKVINSIVIKEYKRLTNGEATEMDQWQAGMILEEAPPQMVDGTGVDIYTFVSYIARAMQQLDEKVEANGK